jgi:predicted transcriptional regulator
LADPIELTDLQIHIMRLIWDRGEATVADLWEALHDERGLALTTVATLLTRLERRGVISRRVEQRQYFYRALVSQDDVQQSMVSELTERLFDGDVTALMNHLLTSNEIAPGDLARLRALIDEAESHTSEEA